jgi:hypothetical protein
VGSIHLFNVQFTLATYEEQGRGFPSTLPPASTASSDSRIELNDHSTFFFSIGTLFETTYSSIISAGSNYLFLYAGI